MTSQQNERFGVYLHVPFCVRRCDYCSFATWADRGHLIETYLAACQTQARAASTSIPEITSVFIGGGTPNLVPADLLMNIFQELPIIPNAEFTVECNPDLVDPQQLETYVAAGVNRISLGVQSMAPHVLTSLGRDHNPDNVYAAVDAVREAGITSLNLDLIYGANGESIQDWTNSVESALSLYPEHLSTYALTVEPGTPLADDANRHPKDDDQADKYLIADALITAAGLTNYEISNWARPGKQCQHNSLYWSQGEYLGLGAAAHSHLDQRRFWNIRTPERFITAVTEGSSVEAGTEKLDPEAWALEGRQLAIRTETGVPERFVPNEVQHLTEPADVEGKLKLTVEGRLLANEVSIRLR